MKIFEVIAPKPNPVPTGRHSPLGSTMMKEEPVEEVSRRDFLKGAGAAVAGAALGAIPGQAKAQANYAEAVRTAVKKAQDAIGGFFWVRFGGARNDIMNHVRAGVTQFIMMYCAQTNGYNVDEVIDYATKWAYDEANAEKPVIQDRMGGHYAIAMANAFVTSYGAAVAQKVQEYQQRGSQQLKQEPQQLKQEPQRQEPHPTQASSEVAQIDAPYYYIDKAIELYVATKGSSDKIHQDVKVELNRSIRLFGIKEYVNKKFEIVQKVGARNISPTPDVIENLKRRNDTQEKKDPQKSPGSEF